MRNSTTIKYSLLAVCLTGVLTLISPGMAGKESNGVLSSGLSEGYPNTLPAGKEKSYKLINAYVTAYNTVSAQTDSTPCLSASGVDICRVDNACACPRDIPFGTPVDILGRRYICLDRMARRFHDRYDISFKEDVEAARQFGIKRLEIKIYDR